MVWYLKADRINTFLFYFILCFSLSLWLLVGCFSRLHLQFLHPTPSHLHQHRSYYKFAIGTTIFAINCVCVSVFLATFYRVYMGPSILCVHWMSYVTKKKRVHTQVWRWLGLVDEEKKGSFRDWQREVKQKKKKKKTRWMLYNVTHIYIMDLFFHFFRPFLRTRTLS